jgi:RHS repeat-associated protein
MLTIGDFSVRFKTITRLTATCLIGAFAISNPSTNLLASNVGVRPTVSPSSPTVVVNRTAPASMPVAAFPDFSSPPTDAEIGRVRVFTEPLARFGDSGPKLDGENEALVAALVDFARAGDPERVEPILRFLSVHPTSSWRASLLLNLGFLYGKTGYYSRQMETLEQAWALARNGVRAGADSVLATRIASELANLNSRLGRQERLAEILDDVDGIATTGETTQRLTGAREGLWMMRNKPGRAFKCGPYALWRIQAHVTGDDRVPTVVAEAASTSRGTSLDQVANWAAQLGMRYQPARRKVGADVLVPAVVHWKSGHYAAIVAREGEGETARYIVQDPTFGYNVALSSAALDEEGSGYCLVPEGALPDGWSPVRSAEAASVFGKGYVDYFESGNTGTCQVQARGCQDTGGMAQWNIHLSVVSLTISDTPIGYTPPLGPEVEFTVTYNQREDGQLPTSSYPNLGPKWLHNWMAWVQYDVNNPDGDAYVHMRGGGTEFYENFNTSTNKYAQQFYSMTTLQRVSTNPVTYERLFPDGSKEVYAASDAAMPDRHIFLSEVVDPTGKKVTLTYDSSMRLTSLTDALGQVTLIRHENLSKPWLITSVLDPFGRVASFGYSNNFTDGKDRLTDTTDVVNIRSEFTYTDAVDADFVTSLGYKDVTNPTNPVTLYGTTTFAHGTVGDATHRLLTVTEPDTDGITTNDTSRVVFYEDGLGGFVTGYPSHPPSGTAPLDEEPLSTSALQARNTFYWDKNQLHAATGLTGPAFYQKATVYHWLHSKWDGETLSGALESMKRPLENRIWFTYGQTGITTFPGPFAKPRKQIQLTVNGTTAPPQQKSVTRYEYNTFGNVTKIIDPIGRETRYDYATNGVDLLRVWQVKNGTPEKQVEYTYYPNVHRVQTMTDAAGQQTSYTYNANWQLESITDARGDVTEFGYENAYLVSVTRYDDSDEKVQTLYDYDAYGRISTVTEAFDSDFTVSFTYDALNRPKRTTYPDSTYEEITYEGTRVRTTRDRLGRHTTYSYDEQQRLESVLDAENRLTSFGWCGCGSMATMTDARGKTTTWTRDLQGRVTAKVLHDGSETAFEYEATAGRLWKVTDNQNRVTEISYNVDDTIAEIDYPGTTLDVTFTYDPYYPRPAEMMDATGPTVLSYYPVAIDSVFGDTMLKDVDGPLTNDTVTLTYDELGRQTTYSVNGVASSWTYDSLGRMDELTNELGTFRYNFDGLTNRVESVSYPNSQSLEFTYFGNLGDHRVQTVTHRSPSGSSLKSFEYAYAANGRVDDMRRDAGTLWDEYGYDEVDQLIKYTPASSPLQADQYRYDSAGNRTGEGVSLNPPTTVSVFNDVNQLTSQSGAVSRTLTYDDNGNLTDDGTREYEWDAADRLTAIEEGTHRSEFTYDGIGRRIRIVEKDSNVVTSDVRYIWMGAEIVEERGSSNQVSRRFYPQGFVDVPGSTKYFYLRDLLGSVWALTDNSGAIVSSYDYKPFGEMTAHFMNSVESPIGYAGYWVHEPSGLNLTWFRAYDPEVGRWLSRDPIGETGGNNLYGYVQNNPILLTDPLGLLPDPCLAEKANEKFWRTARSAYPYLMLLLKALDVDTHRTGPDGSDMMPRFLEGMHEHAKLKLQYCRGNLPPGGFSPGTSLPSPTPTIDPGPRPIGPYAPPPRKLPGYNGGRWRYIDVPSSEADGGTWRPLPHGSPWWVPTTPGVMGNPVPRFTYRMPTVGRAQVFLR